MVVMPMNENRFLVVIPYCSDGAQGRELEYAVAGWRRHFKEKYLIVLVGDHHPVCGTGEDIVHLPCPRVPPCGDSNYRPHLDHVHKFREVRKHYPDADGFIYACDDMYAVNDFDISDIKLLKQLSKDMKGDAKSKNGWQRDMARTRALCVKEGFPVRNFICHLPLWYDFAKLFALYDRFDLDHTSYVVENIYFNMYYPQKIPFELNLEQDNLKCGIYSKDFPVETIREAFRKKIWISNSPDGWSAELDAMLKEYYGIGDAVDAGTTARNRPENPEDQPSLPDLAKRIAGLEAGIKSCNDGLNTTLDLLTRVLMLLETHAVREGFRHCDEQSDGRFGELAILCDKYGSDKGSRNYSSGKAHPYRWRPHTYAQIYELLFAPIRHTVRYVFECGLGTNNPKLASNMGARGKPGASLRAWRDYFAGDALVCVWGADIDKDVLFEEEKIKTGFMDQLSPETIQSFFNTVGDVKFDVMIDDGLHTANAAISLFDNAVAHLAPDGFYIIEDVPFQDVEILQGYFSVLPDYDVNYVSIPLIKEDNTLIVVRRKKERRV